MWKKLCKWCAFKEAVRIEQKRQINLMCFGTACWLEYRRPWWDIRRYILGIVGVREIDPKEFYKTTREIEKVL